MCGLLKADRQTDRWTDRHTLSARSSLFSWIEQVLEILSNADKVLCSILRRRDILVTNPVLLILSIWQIVKTSMKMPLNSPGSALFAKINTIFRERKMPKFRKLTCDPLKYKMDQSMHAYCINMYGKSITMKRENNATL